MAFGDPNYPGATNRLFIQLQPQYTIATANTTVYPQVVTVGGYALPALSLPTLPAKDDDMAWLLRQVEEIREMAFA